MRSWFSHFEQMDWTLLLTAFTLTAIGLVGIYGIGASQDPPQYFLFQKQLAVACIGLVITIGLSFVHFQTMRAYSFLAYIGGAILLAAVLVFGVHIRGTTGWFKLGSLSFQPVEIAKVTLCMYLAAYFSKVSQGRLTWKTFGLSLLPTLGYVGLVMLQPDFGSAMTLMAIWGMMAAFVGLPRRAWVILPIVAVIAIGSIWTVLQPYQRARVTNFLHPELNARGSGYNAIQARIAIGSGGWLGKGVGEGSQARLRFLPEASTDFMIAVVGEEMGFIGMIVILALYLFLFYRLLRLASEIHHPYASFLLVGIGATFLVHMTVNIGMNLGLLPITGIPLPYISAAASFLLFNCFVSLGIIQSIAARRPISQLMDREQDEIDALAL